MKTLRVLVTNCSTCLELRNKQPKEPLIKHEILPSPWLKVGTELFTLYNRDYVLVVDYYSKFVEIAPLKNASSQNVIKDIF